jgi:hypothetical protein
MALHYFHHSNGKLFLDDVGTELADLNSVRTEAVRTCRDLMWSETASSLWSGAPWKLWVTDMPNDSGKTVLTLEVSAT